MKKRILFGFSVLALLVLATLVIWQGSLDFGNYRPESSAQVYLLWAVSTLVVLLTITLSFMLGRAAVKLYIERRQGVEGSRIRTKLVFGALALSVLPAVLVVFFDVEILNRTPKARHCQDRDCRAARSRKAPSLVPRGRQGHPRSDRGHGW